jgi:pyruvate,water dikinase
MTMRTEKGNRCLCPPQKKKSVLSDAQATELARLGMKIEEIYGMPMDVEWALKLPSPAGTGGEGFSILQARPITALPPEWAMPDPKALYGRGSLAEHIPSPVTPLFATLGLEIANQATAEMCNRVIDRMQRVFSPAVDLKN